MNTLLTSRYQVLTSNGFKDFDGIKCVVNDAIEVEFDDSTKIICSIGHKFVDDEHKFVTHNNESEFNSRKIVTTCNVGKQKLYDLVNVADGNHYTTSGVESSNCAFVPGFEDFWKATFPVISSGEESKVVLTSTPNGLNHYHDMWNAAVGGISTFKPYTTTWRAVQNRLYKNGLFDDGVAFEKETIGNTSAEAFQQEHLCLLGDSVVEVVIDGEYRRLTVEELYELETLHVSS